MPIEKFAYIVPMPGQGKRVMKSKLLTALGATGPNRPYTANPEHILERKILLQTPFNYNPSTPVVPVVPSNGLLNSLVHFYQFQESASLFADSGSSNVSLNYTNAGAAFIRTTGHVQPFAGSYTGIPGVNSVGTIAAAPFDFSGDGTGNIPMTWAFWGRFDGGSGGQPSTATLVSIWTPVFYFAWVSTNNLQFNMQNAGGTTITCTSPFVYDNNWHLFVGGFDKANSVIFFSIDNGAKITQAMAQAKSVNSTPFNIGNCNACGGNCPVFSFSDVGIWKNRALVASDISSLWNGGAGLPFSQFTT